MGRLIRSLLDSLKLTDEDDEYEDEDFDIVMDNERKREVVPKRENPPLRKYEEQKLSDADEDEEEEEEDDEPLAQRRTFNAKPASQPSQGYNRGLSFNQPTGTSQRNSYHPQRSYQQPQTKTAVPLRSSLSDRRIYVLNPKSFEDAKEVCETIKAGGVIFMNFEGVKYELAQRLMDFAGGAVYAVNGQIYQISGYNFIAAPGDTDIEGDILAQITSASDEFPTFSKY